ACIVEESVACAGVDMNFVGDTVRGQRLLKLLDGRYRNARVCFAIETQHGGLNPGSIFFAEWPAVKGYSSSYPIAVCGRGEGQCASHAPTYDAYFWRGHIL